MLPVILRLFAVDPPRGALYSFFHTKIAMARAAVAEYATRMQQHREPHRDGSKMNPI